MSFSLLSLVSCIFAGMLCTQVNRNRAPHLCVELWVSCRSGVRCIVVRVAFSYRAVKQGLSVLFLFKVPEVLSMRT